MRATLSILAAAGMSCLLLAPKPAAAAAAVASWQMNEGAGAKVMVDSSGHGHNGSIGSKVVTGTLTPGSHGYTFGMVSGSTQSRVVTVPHSSALNPGTSAFAITVRLHTRVGNQNIVQKGQANTVGGYYKVDMTQGRLHCEFRDRNRRIKATGSRRPVNDARWHTLRCARGPAGVTLTVDGSTATNAGSWGVVSNGAPVSIGGKLFCSAPGTGCDNFAGVIDYVRIER
jgi:hypothetical protein